MKAEVKRLGDQMMQAEIDACNEAGRALAKAKADREVDAERARLTREADELRVAKAAAEATVRELTDELAHARERASAAADKAAAEREAHSVWQAHVDATLAQCRRRLVA